MDERSAGGNGLLFTSITCNIASRYYTTLNLKQNISVNCSESVTQSIVVFCRGGKMGLAGNLSGLKQGNEIYPFVKIFSELIAHSCANGAGLKMELCHLKCEMAARRHGVAEH